jgi:hypothetical protein
LSGNNPPGEHKTVELKIKQNDTPQLPDDAADYARAQLEALVRRFENPDEPYRSLVLSMWTARYGDYDNLARVEGMVRRRRRLRWRSGEGSAHHSSAHPTRRPAPPIPRHLRSCRPTPAPARPMCWCSA